MSKAKCLNNNDSPNVNKIVVIIFHLIEDLTLYSFLAHDLTRNYPTQDILYFSRCPLNTKKKKDYYDVNLS